jgi:hypothetical protein
LLYCSSGFTGEKKLQKRFPRTCKKWVDFKNYILAGQLKGVVLRQQVSCMSE